MSNKYRPHILVLPEDKAISDIANGFITLNPNLNDRAIKVLTPVGGWKKVVEEFKNVHSYEMKKYPERRIVLVIDLENHIKRLSTVKGEIPIELNDRVFVLSVLSDPEDLNAKLNRNGLEDIGKSLSQECSDNTREVWGHDLLKHNETELDRMVLSVKPFLFN